MNWLYRPNRNTEPTLHADLDELKELLGDGFRRAKCDGSIVFVGHARPAR